MEGKLEGGGRGENVMALWGLLKSVISLWALITLFEKRYCVMKNLDVMALWRSITLFSKTLCVINSFQKRFSVMAPPNPLWRYGVMALW